MNQTNYEGYGYWYLCGWRTTYQVRLILSSDIKCNAGAEEGEAKEGEQQANSPLDESHAENPIELLNRMSGKSDRLRDSAKPILSPITPTFEHDGYLTSQLFQ